VSIPEIDDLLKSYTDRPNGIAGLAVVAVDKDGKTIYSGTSGKTSVDPSKATPMTMDSVYWIASQTKLLTAISAMQCVERGQIRLDDPVGEIVPELADPDILEGFNEEGRPKLRKATIEITLKMLLAHTSGIAYAGADPNLKKWSENEGLVGFSGHMKDFTHPLIFEPGTTWMYGPGIDWVGQMIERLNNCTLGEYMEKNIFTPLGMNSATFHPENRPEIEARLVDTTHRLPDSTLASLGRLYKCPAPHDLGGVGLYCTPTDYAKVLVPLLQGGGGLLKPESVDEIFKPHVTKEVADAHTRWMKETNNISADCEVTFGLTVSVAVTPFPDNRAAGSVSWGGLPCLAWWVDRETGIAATIFQQTMPPMDPLSVEFARKFEALLYKHVRA